LRSAEVQRAERAWLTRELTGGRTGLDAVWVALVVLNVVAIAAWLANRRIGADREP
jgi:uncharacterized membrane protein YwaF